MKPITVFTLAAIVISTAVAAPSLSHAESYFLRVDAPTEPYHHRHLILLPSSWRLGLENFTVHPPTPPITFTPVRLSSGTFALRGIYNRSASTETSYISALIAKDGSRPATMSLVFAPQPDKETIAKEPQACPDGFECRADVWTGVDAGQLRFGAAVGSFEPVKEAPEGWVVYWKGSGDGEVNHPVRLEVVLVQKKGGHGYGVVGAMR